MANLLSIASTLTWLRDKLTRESVLSDFDMQDTQEFLAEDFAHCISPLIKDEEMSADELIATPMGLKVLSEHYLPVRQLFSEKFLHINLSDKEKPKPAQAIQKETLELPVWPNLYNCFISLDKKRLASQNEEGVTSQTPPQKKLCLEQFPLDLKKASRGNSPVMLVQKNFDSPPMLTATLTDIPPTKTGSPIIAYLESCCVASVRLQQDNNNNHTPAVSPVI